MRNQAGIESVKAWDGSTSYIKLIHEDIIYPVPFGQETFEKYASNRVQWYPIIGWVEPLIKGKRDPLGGVLYSRDSNGNILAHSYLIPNIRYEKNSDGYIIPIQE